MSTIKRTKLEELQKKHNKQNFIKSYPILTTINELSLSDIRLIELVLSFQDRDLIFKMSYFYLGSLIGVKPTTVGNIVLKLNKLGIVITNTKPNSVKGGKDTELLIDVDRLIEYVPAPSTESKDQDNEPASAPEPEPLPTEETQEPEPIEVEEPQEVEQVRDEVEPLTFDQMLKRDAVKEQEPPAPKPEPTEKDKLKQVASSSTLNMMQIMHVEKLIDSEELKDVEAVNLELAERKKILFAGKQPTKEKIT